MGVILDWTYKDLSFRFVRIKVTAWNGSVGLLFLTLWFLGGFYVIFNNSLTTNSLENKTFYVANYKFEF